jgi:hypothetical protein
MSEGYGVIASLEAALKAADDAKREGLLGYYPAACVVLASEIARVQVTHDSGVRACDGGKANG